MKIYWQLSPKERLKSDLKQMPFIVLILIVIINMDISIEAKITGVVLGLLNSTLFTAYNIKKIREEKESREE
ncbi:MAG: hypothetical protein ACRC5C_02060 [Bacilli bacterium]